MFNYHTFEVIEECNLIYSFGVSESLSEFELNEINGGGLFEECARNFNHCTTNYNNLPTSSGRDSNSSCETFISFGTSGSSSYSA